MDRDGGAADPGRPARYRPRRRRGALRALRHRLRPWIARPLAALARGIGPPLYLLYMRLVFATSRFEAGDFAARLARIGDEHGGAVALMWHEEVMGVPYAYARAGARGHALVALGDGGDVLARILERCGHGVSRGGSSRRRSRRQPGLVRDLVAGLRAEPGRVYGFAVDGSKGPRYRMKRGGLVVARACGVPLVLVRVWYRRCLRLRTWDRFAIPLPFGEIRLHLRGPYPVPEEAQRPEGLERLRQGLEAELGALAARSCAEFGQPPPRELPLPAPGTRVAAQAPAQESAGFPS